MAKLETGIYDISFKEYQAINAINQSGLKNILKCPAYYEYKRDNFIDTDAMRFGRMLHSFILENKTFKNDYYITEKIRRAGSKWDTVLFEAGNREVFFHEDLEAAAEIQHSLSENEYYIDIATNSAREQSLIWKDDEMGLFCKARLDGFIEIDNKHLAFDLKTTRDCSKSAFIKSFFTLGYDVQAAFYLDGYSKITGNTPEFFVIFAVEKEAPYLNANYAIPYSSSIIENGRAIYKKALKTYKECVENDNFDIGLSEGTTIIDDVPAWRIINNNEEN